ncbi:bacteriorhodopsin [Hymenobacter sp. HD11105]
MTDTTLYSIYIICMVLGAILFLYWGLADRRGVPRAEYLVAFLIPVWSATAYFALSTGQGTTEAGDTTHFARYLDWVVTTPLLLFALASTGMYYIKKDRVIIGGLVLADVFMILTGLIADLSTGSVRWVWYGLGVMAFLGIMWTLWGPLRRRAHSQGPALAAVYNKALSFLTILWIAYPVIWALGPTGIGALDSFTEKLLFVVVPILSKVGFSIVDLSGLRSLREQPEELAFE